MHELVIGRQRCLWRRPVAGAIGAAVVAGLLPAFAATTVAAAPVPTTREVRYAGAVVTVPATWPVVDLTADPTQCVRFDRPAVYLGHAGPAPQCPARLVGRDDAIQVEPLDASTTSRGASATTAASVNGEPAKVDPAADVAGERHVVFTRRSLLVTVSLGRDRAVSDGVLRSFTFTAPAPTAAAHAASPLAPAAAAAPRAASPSVRVGTVVTGEGFDACTAPSEATMSAWLSSPYRSIGVYIGGINRGCAQPNLTATWLVDEANQGWSFIPIYVGRQAPCNIGFTSIDPAQSGAQGVAAADDAANSAAALGMAQGSALYFDMEGYDAALASCSQTTLAFLDAWTAELHARNFESGVYSSAASGVADLARNYSNAAFHTPDDIWFADWSCCPHSAYGDSFFSDSLWSPHRRLHQYSGGHPETWGGVQVNVDSDYVDGALVGGLPGYTLDAYGGIHNFGGAPFVYGTGYWPGRDVARGIALRPGAPGGYVLDDLGGIHPFGGAPFVYGTSYWPNWDIARGIAMNPCDATASSGYVLDGWGGIHPFGGAPAVVGSGYWPGWDIARGLVTECIGGRVGGYTLDGWGGVHQVGAAPTVSGGGYWPGRDIATGLALNALGGGYVLDGWGGLTPFGGAIPLQGSAYWPGTKTARGIALGRSGLGGYVVDVTGGLHFFGRATPLVAAPFSAPLGRGLAVSA